MDRRRRTQLLAMPVDELFPIYSKPLFQGKAKWEAIDMKMILQLASF